MVLEFRQALAVVKGKLAEANLGHAAEFLPLERAHGRVLAEQVLADRDYPPFPRAIRDGYAVRSGDLRALPALLECVGEVRAGQHFTGRIGPGQCVEIMTGAPVPAGADAVVMVEHARQEHTRVEISRGVVPFENVVRQGSEVLAGSCLLRRGRRLGSAEIALLASVGRAHVEVFRQPRVAILPTGDEVVPIEQPPEWFQIRNSNAMALTAQVTAAGAIPQCLPIAADELGVLRRRIEEGLEADLLLVSGGVSVGKHDLVKQVLAEFGAELFFQGVLIRPGKPTVFGRARGKFFFGLPGNPVSTFVTFELFVRRAIAVLGGAEFEELVFLRARLRQPLRQTLGLTLFMPARVELQKGDPVVSLVAYQGSGDLAGVAAANCFLVVHPEQTDLAAGDWVDVLPKPM